jgi:hypothetical protein
MASSHRVGRAYLAVRLAIAAIPLDASFVDFLARGFKLDPAPLDF